MHGAFRFAPPFLAVIAKGNVGSPSCQPYKCDGASANCPVTCAADTDCSAGLICNCAGRCVSPLPNGACCKALLAARSRKAPAARLARSGIGAGPRARHP